jgi:hypothetical protein
MLNRYSRNRACYLAWVYLTQNRGQAIVVVDTLVKLSPSNIYIYKMYFIWLCFLKKHLYLCRIFINTIS